MPIDTKANEMPLNPFDDEPYDAISDAFATGSFAITTILDSSVVSHTYDGNDSYDYWLVADNDDDYRE